MTTPELIDLFLLPACFRPPLGDQLGHQITACSSLSKSPPKAFKRGQAGFHQQPIVLDADAEDIALAEAKFFAHLRRNHDAPLFTDSHLCHQELNVAEMRQHGNKFRTANVPVRSGENLIRVWNSGIGHVHAIAAEWHALGPQALALAVPLGQRAISADHSPPGEIRLVAFEKD